MSIDSCLTINLLATYTVVDASAIQNTYVDSVMCVTTPPVQDGVVITVITYVSQLKSKHMCMYMYCTSIYTYV